MTNRKTTRRALVLSLLSLLLCCSMLVGTTFAWFTDSVTSGKNQIVAGNLDIELDYSKTMADGSWADVEGQTDLVDPNALWEPGHTEVVYLRLTNAGTLVLKYNFAISVANSVIGKSVLGNDIELAKYLKYGLLEGVAAKFDDRDAAREEAEKVAKDLAAYSDNGVMEPGDIRTMALVIYMPEEVGNEANYRGTAIPTIDLGVTVVATQKDAETDSFGPDYDATAGWLGDADTDWYDETKTEYVVSTAEELAGLAALVNSGVNMKGKTIKLGANINLDGAAWTPIGNAANGFHGTLDGAGYTVSNLHVEGTTSVGLVGYALYGGNVKNLTVENAYVKGNDYAGAIMGRGYTDIDNCHVKNATIITTPYLNDKGIYDGGAKAGGIVGQLLEGEGNTVTNCSATNVTVYAYRDLGGVVGMVHNNNSCSGNTATNVTLGYILCDQITADKNENAGAIYGRVQSSATVSPAKDSAENQAYTLIYAVEGATAATSLTSFIEADEATDKTIVLLSDVTGDVTVSTKENVKITIDGNGKNFPGVITVDGKSATYLTAGLTIKDLTFKADSISADACIRLGNGSNATRYTTNVTVDGCTFDVPGAVGVKSYTGGDKNLTITNCTATADAHSLIQAKGIDGIRIENCKVYSKNGLNFNNSDNVQVIGCTVDVKGYAVRFGESSGGVGAAETYLIKNCSLKSANDEGDATIVLRGTADYATLTIENTTIVGDPDIQNTATDAKVVK